MSCNFLRAKANPIIPINPIPIKLAVPPTSETGCAPTAEEKEKFGGVPLKGSCEVNAQLPGVLSNPAYFKKPDPVTERVPGDPPWE
jgi:hypothetical protein